MIINPYLNFNGNTEEVFNFYKAVFGGDFPFLMRFNQEPPEANDQEGCMDQGIPEEEGNGIMHIALPIGKSMLMGTDVPSTMPQVTAGTNISLCVSVDSRADADRIFAALGAGGTVQMPMADMFWGDYYGMLTDKYQIQWMISYNEAQDGKAAQS
ncbi:VOC family protein [Pedobacter nanyangensis]|uniref:VOC family protein n=1 Tax=Pedobacter nanyangensis TaxID=1562389 RepID=UPI000DE30F4E|nr:VOC family protein [Pedobacter nanyangensis]